jgi:uncharacterized Ntn-hydrolase superfamily protein
MAQTYASEPKLPMAARLLTALKAGAAAHAGLGDMAGAVSSALLVRAPSDLVQIDLRVDLARLPPAEGGDAIADLGHLFKAYAPLVEVYERRSQSPEPGEAARRNVPSLENQE